jgi:hypothetical protein
MHAETLVSAPFEYFSESYLSCDSEVIIEEGIKNSLAWMGGSGPQPTRQVFEYTDADYGYEYDPVSCPVGEKPDSEDNPIDTQGEDENPEVEESQQTEEEPEDEEIVETEEENEELPVQDEVTEEAPTAERPDEESQPQENIDPCDLLPINGVVMDQAPGYCRGEYNVEPYISVIVSQLDLQISTDEACQSLSQENSRQVIEAVNYGDCGFIRLMSITSDKPTMDYHAGWDITFILDRFMVDIYTYDWYATNKIWLEELASAVESNIRNHVK